MPTPHTLTGSTRGPAVSELKTFLADLPDDAVVHINNSHHERPTLPGQGWALLVAGRVAPVSLAKAGDHVQDAAACWSAGLLAQVVPNGSAVDYFQCVTVETARGFYGQQMATADDVHAAGLVAGDWSYLQVPGSTNNAQFPLAYPSTAASDVTRTADVYQSPSGYTQQNAPR